ncbi:hypothetical protein BDV23DRAFT_175027 [Aspergillus alliaceus]|uniref:Transcription factor domain-containing protein n=1 Tax=Petromyces alliaceus TaxID=209559 RepID=A0A5N7BYS0_PETAA|nr:hypothetical protein BDV23DRAFT_175027 [Aspergillus alliaceus]
MPLPRIADLIDLRRGQESKADQPDIPRNNFNPPPLSQYNNEYDHHPCSKCSSDGHRFVVATPRRGGHYSRLGGIQNRLEALQILAQTASSERGAERRKPRITEIPTDPMPAREANRSALPQASRTTHTPLTSELMRNGILDIPLLEPLPQYDLFATFLLTAVLTIATKDRVGLEGLHRRISEYMEKLLLRVILGAASVRHVGVMEGLLLLAEWVPHISNGPSHQVQATAEDSVAWSLIGLALRQPYLLHLELYSFRGECKDEDRGQLICPVKFLANRQIWIQMGQSFWCRGPAKWVKYASYIQAEVELTTIFGNIRDILYASKTRTAMWKETWVNIDLPPHLSDLLFLQFGYLRLYINAFAFQTVLYSWPKSATRSDNANADGKHIYIAIDAAKRVLKYLVERLNATKHFRYMRVRCEIHVSVFLFKAFMAGALSPKEQQSCPTLSRDLTQNPLSTPIDLDDITNSSIIESTESHPHFPEDFPDPQAFPFLESPEAQECPDAFLSNLPFLRGRFPDPDNQGVGQLLMDL